MTMINFFLFWVDFPELVVYALQNAGCHSFSRQKNPHHRLPEILVYLGWYTCGAVGLSVYGHVIAQFFSDG